MWARGGREEIMVVNQNRPEIRCFGKPHKSKLRNKLKFHPKNYPFDTPIFKKHQDKFESWVERALKVTKKIKDCYNHSYMAIYKYQL